MRKSGSTKTKYTGIFVPAEIMEKRNLSMVEKILISDIGYFNANGYRFSNTQIATKLGVSRRTIINSIGRLKSSKLGFVVSIGPDDYHRILKLNGAISALFEKVKGEKVAPLQDESSANIAPSSEKVAPLKGEKVAPKDNSVKNNKRKERIKFKKPTPNEVTEYTKSINYVLDGQYFCDYHKARGWKLKGGQPMKDWKATVRTWKYRNFNRAAQPTREVTEEEATELLKEVQRDN